MFNVRAKKRHSSMELIILTSLATNMARLVFLLLNNDFIGYFFSEWFENGCISFIIIFEFHARRAIYCLRSVE